MSLVLDIVNCMAPIHVVKYSHLGVWKDLPEAIQGNSTAQNGANVCQMRSRLARNPPSTYLAPFLLT